MLTRLTRHNHRHLATLGYTSTTRLLPVVDYQRHHHVRQAGFLAGVAGRIASRLLLGSGILGGAGYLIDRKIDEWDRETWGPIKSKFEQFKSVTKPFRDIPGEIIANFSVPDLEAEFERTSIQAKIEAEKARSDYGEGADVMAVPLTGALVYSQRDGDLESDERTIDNELAELKATLTIEFEAEKAKLLADIESMLGQIEKLKAEISTLEDMNAEAERVAVAGSKDEAALFEKFESLQKEIMSAEMRHQKQVKRLELENDELHARLAKSRSRLGSGSTSSVDQHSGEKVSMVELYSSVLDALETSKSHLSYLDQPELPRVVVVGDQSSGKTSVLELVAKARIFPRGAGQMMTRSPVKVTVTEGRRHLAQFAGSNEEYQLDNESDLCRLRDEIERRMNGACAGKTVSNETIKINIKGPGLKRMILIDLPGLIATETAGIAPGTKDDIIELAKGEMEHPKSIILCVQDGSVDAERSQITDFVRRADPTGERTVLVLTKVDKAICDPVRLKQILDGKLFPLRALGYFAVVAGMDDRNASINQIRAYESDVFQTSELFRQGLMKPEQLGTGNMCDTVSRTFWSMVKHSLKGELAKLSDHLFALETEWKNNYRNVRELDRNQLFEKAKEEILDRLVQINVLDEGKFEDELKDAIWARIEKHFVKEIYLPAESGAGGASEFNTLADIRLRHFTNLRLPTIALEAAGDLLLSHFDQTVSSQNAIFSGLFDHVKKESRSSFHHELEQISPTILDELRVLQQATVSNRFIQSSPEWQAASEQLHGALRRDLERCEKQREGTCGPIWYKQWSPYNWSSRTKDQLKNDRTKRILDNLPKSTGSRLTKEEVTKARYEVDKQYGYKMSEEEIDNVWRDIYAVRWISRLSARATDCKNCYQKYKNNKISEKRSALLCEDVVLWWRMNKAIEITAANLRQRMLNEKGTEYLHRGIESALTTAEADPGLVMSLITGRQVELAEEIKFIKNITDLLKCLNERLQHESI